MNKAGIVQSSEKMACGIALVLALALKFWLVQASEIIDDYHDPSEYVLQILYPVNGGLGYGQGTGAFARIFYQLGISYRWAIEVTFMGACLLAFQALLDRPVRTYLVTALFLFVLFDPAFMEQLSQMYSDQVWMLETVVGFSCLIFAVQRDCFRWPWLIPSVIALGYSTITRSVFFPLIIALAAFTGVVLVILLRDRKKRGGKHRFDVFFLAMWSVYLGIGAFYGGNCLYNQQKFGFYGISAVDSNEYKNLFLCLQSVGDATGVNYCPIDKNRRSLIAQAGPRSRWLMERLDQDHEDNQAGLDQYGVYDIPSGQFDWAVFHTLMPVCHGNFPETFAYFRAVEDEITQAHKRGTLQTRFILPLPDSRLGVVGKIYPDALKKTIAALLHEPAPAYFNDSQNPAHFQYKTFDKALHRRTMHDSPVRNQIWSRLSRIYARIYTPWLLGLFLLSLATYGALSLTKKEPVTGSLDVLVRPLFLVMFFVLLGWYSLFVASGLPPLSRYMIYNHAMLPALTAYMISRIIQLCRKSPSKRRVE